ncbi:MAG: toll/interleukin-1 receptor domain-containing protein [Flavobacteriales bacterium]|nr:toll/interleukin-1 receptor domain-containing protein [Flavobacteriales bacterium]
MKVFLSWSGTKSHKLALTLRDWLPSVIQSVEPYVSSEDIDKGARWSTDIAKELEDSGFGILCVTKENLNAPWLTFEAGALSKKLDKSYVSPFLFDIKRAEITGPILQFQSTVFEKEDVKKLVYTINKALGDEKLAETRLEKTFEVWYPNLEKELNSINEDFESTETLEEPLEENISSKILEEILELTRINQKLLRSPDILFPPDYLRHILKSEEEDEKEKMFQREQNMMLREIEHTFFRLREMIDIYKNEEKPIDSEIEEIVMRSLSIFKEYQHIERRLKRNKRL